MSEGCGISKFERWYGEMSEGYVRLIEECARIELHGSEMNELGTAEPDDRYGRPFRPPGDRYQRIPVLAQLDQESRHRDGPP